MKFSRCYLCDNTATIFEQAPYLVIKILLLEITQPTEKKDGRKREWGEWWKVKV